VSCDKQSDEALDALQSLLARILTIFVNIDGPLVGPA
jgi:hypothetical protein